MIDSISTAGRLKQLLELQRQAIESESFVRLSRINPLLLKQLARICSSIGTEEAVFSDPLSTAVNCLKLI